MNVPKTALETFQKFRNASARGDEVTSHFIAAQQFWFTLAVTLLLVLILPCAESKSPTVMKHRSLGAQSSSEIATGGCFLLTSWGSEFYHNNRET